MIRSYLWKKSDVFIWFIWVNWVSTKKAFLEITEPALLILGEIAVGSYFSIMLVRLIKKKVNRSDKS